MSVSYIISFIARYFVCERICPVVVMMVYDLSLTNGAHEFKRSLEQFIQNKHIDPEAVSGISSFISAVPEYKKAVADGKNNIDSVKVFSGLNALDTFILAAKKHLEGGIARKENPKSAEDLMEFSSDIIALANQIDMYVQNQNNASPSQINDIALHLREKMRLKELIKLNEIPKSKGEKKFSEKIFERSVLAE